MVKAVIKSARAGGKIVRPWVGGDFQDVTPALAESLGFDRPQGVLIAALNKQSPLLTAGLKQGDVILTVDGKSVGDAQELDYRLATLAVGDRAKVSYSRDHQTYVAEVKLIAAPEIPPRQQTLIRGRSPFTGLEVVNISPAVAEEFNLPTTTQGVVVSDVKGGYAAQVGFQKGDILVSINGEKIRSVDELRGVLTQPVGAWRFVINRGGRMISGQL
jgi:S1-C subfamily serine protease